MKKLGPCPLCGGEAERSEAFETWIVCLNCGFKEWEHQWQKVADLAASERRMREALDILRGIFHRAHLSGVDQISQGDLFNLALICDEALKGGEG